MNLAGNVQQEVRYPNDDLISKEFKPLIDALGKVVHQYNCQVLFIYECLQV